MGTNTDAILCYGVELEPRVKLNVPDNARGIDDEFDDYNIAEMWDQVYLAKTGIYPPQVPYEGNEEIYDKYWNTKRTCEQIAGIEIVHHCSNEETLYIVAATGSVIRSWRGYPRKVESLEIKGGWDSDIMRFCEDMGFEVSKPKWLLCSWWG